MTVHPPSRVLIVLDDDPTGTQSVAGLPVLTQWSESDLRSVLALGAPAIYVLTNARSLDPQTAARLNTEVVRNALAAAGSSVSLVFVSRSDSTLRGHFPLEPDTIADAMFEYRHVRVDAIVMVPAFPEAGRVTIGGVHYLRDASGGLVPIGETEFARDATFGFTSSDLADYVQEKSNNSISADAVVRIDLALVRSGPSEIAAALAAVSGRVPVVVDAETESDLRTLSQGLVLAEAQGKTFVYRVGPPFVRAMIGQSPREPLSTREVFEGTIERPGGGLIVVGSHVGMTTRQLAVLLRQRAETCVVELEVSRLIGDERPDDYLAEVTRAVIHGLGEADVVLQTSRGLVRSEDGAESLRIARTVSSALVAVVRAVVTERLPRFIVAKGGITSADVASRGLSIHQAIVRGPLLPGIVSLWDPSDGPARGVPYVVFAGNVGSEDSLLDVVDKLSDTAR